MNNYDFTEVLHDEAVDILKSSARLNMKVCFIGKVPASSYSQLNNEWTTARQSPDYQTNSSSSSVSGKFFSTPPPDLIWRSSAGSPSQRRRHPPPSLFKEFEKQDTPTLLITDSDNENLVQSSPDPGIYLMDTTEAILKSSPLTDRRLLLRQRLQSTKSEEEEQILDEESLKYLTENERITLAYYRNEYVTKSMTIDAFVAMLLELLDTNQKVSKQVR